MTQLVGPMAAVLTAAGVIAGVAALASTRQGLLALRVALELWTAAGLFLLARVAHGLGMDEGKPGRGVGTGLTLALQLLLGLWAISVPITGAYSPAVKDVDVTTARG